MDLYTGVVCMTHADQSDQPFHTFFAHFGQKLMPIPHTNNDQIMAILCGKSDILTRILCPHTSPSFSIFTAHSTPKFTPLLIQPPGLFRQEESLSDSLA